MKYRAIASCVRIRCMKTCFPHDGHVAGATSPRSVTPPRQLRSMRAPVSWTRTPMTRRAAPLQAGGRPRPPIFEPSGVVSRQYDDLPPAADGQEANHRVTNAELVRRARNGDRDA